MVASWLTLSYFTLPVGYGSGSSAFYYMFIWVEILPAGGLQRRLVILSTSRNRLPEISVIRPTFKNGINDIPVIIYIIRKYQDLKWCASHYYTQWLIYLPKPINHRPKKSRNLYIAPVILNMYFIFFPAVLQPSNIKKIPFRF